MEILPNELNNIIFRYNHQLMMKDICEDLNNIFKTNIKVCSCCNKKKFHIYWSQCFDCDENICSECSINKQVKQIEEINIPLCYFCSQ